MSKAETVILLLFDVVEDRCLCVCVRLGGGGGGGGGLPVSGYLCADFDVYFCRTLFSPSYICISPYMT